MDTSSAPPEEQPIVEPDETPLESLLLVSVGGEWVGIPSDGVREILPARPFTRLPGAPTTVAGLVNVQGRVITVLDLARCLQLPPAVTAPGHRLVLVEHRGRVVGLAVDDVVRIVRVEVPALEFPASTEPPFVRAVGDVERRRFRVLDPAALLLPILA